jgi:hypothetical protein
MPGIEKVRLRREEQVRRADNVAPRKASPYHNPNLRNDVAKILVTKDAIDDEFYDDIDLPKVDVPPPPMNPVPAGGGTNQQAKPAKSNPQGGRPLNEKDKTKRKTKTVLPKSGEAAAILWAYNVQKAIADEVTPMMLDFYKKKNVRSLTRGEFDQLEYLKLCLLTGIEPFVELNSEIIKELIDKSHRPSEAFVTEVGDEIENFVYLNTRKPTVDEMKYIYASVYVNLSAVEV